MAFAGAEGPSDAYLVTVNSSGTAVTFKENRGCSELNSTKLAIAEVRAQLVQLEKRQTAAEARREATAEATLLKINDLSLQTKETVLQTKLGAAKAPEATARSDLEFELTKRHRAVAEANRLRGETRRLEAMAMRLDQSIERLRNASRDDNQAAAASENKVEAVADKAMAALLKTGRVKAKSRAELVGLQQAVDEQEEEAGARQERVASLTDAANAAAESRKQAEAARGQAQARQIEIATAKREASLRIGHLEQAAERQAANLEREGEAAHKAESEEAAAIEELGMAQEQARSRQERLGIQLEAKARLEAKLARSRQLLSEAEQALVVLGSKQRHTLARLGALTNETNAMHRTEVQILARRTAIEPNASSLRNRMQELGSELEKSLVAAKRTEAVAEKVKATVARSAQLKAAAGASLKALRLAEQNHMLGLSRIIARGGCNCSADAAGCDTCGPERPRLSAPRMAPQPGSVAKMQEANAETLDDSGAARQRSKGVAEQAAAVGASAMAASQRAVADFISGTPNVAPSAPDDPFIVATRAIADTNEQLEAVANTITASASQALVNDTEQADIANEIAALRSTSEAAVGPPTPVSGAIANRATDEPDAATMLRFRSSSAVGSLRATRTASAQQMLEADTAIRRPQPATSAATVASTTLVNVKWTPQCMAWIGKKVELDRLRSQAAETTAKVLAMEMTPGNTAAELAELRAAHESLKQEVATLEDEIAVAKNETATMTSRAAAVRKENAAIAPSLQTAEQGATDLWARVSQLQMQQEEGEALAADAHKNAVRAEKELETTAKLLDDEKDAFLNARIERETARTAVQVRLTNASTTIRESERSARDLEAEEATNHEAALAAKQEVMKAKLHADAAEGELQVEQRIEQARAARLSGLEATIAETRTRRVDAQGAILQHSAAAASASRAASEAGAAADSARAAAKKLVAQLDNSDAKVLARTTAHMLQSLEVRKLNDQLDSRQGAATVLGERVKHLSQEQDAVEATVANGDAAIATMEHEVASAQAKQRAAQEVAAAAAQAAQQEGEQLRRTESQLDAASIKRHMAPPSTMQDWKQVQQRRAELESIVGGSRAAGAEALASQTTGLQHAPAVPQAAADEKQPASPITLMNSEDSEEEPQSPAAVGAMRDAAVTDALEASAVVDPADLPGATGEEFTNALLGDGSAEAVEKPDSGDPSLNAEQPSTGENDASPVAALGAASSEGDSVEETQPSGDSSMETDQDEDSSGGDSTEGGVDSADESEQKQVGEE